MIAAVLFAGLWQGAIFTAAAAIVVRCISRYDASTRYVVWYAALLATAVVPPATLYLHLWSRSIPRRRMPCGRD